MQLIEGILKTNQGVIDDVGEECHGKGDAGEEYRF